MLEDLLTKYWPQLLGLVIVVMWLTRLESMEKHNKQRIKELAERQSKIEGKYEATDKEVNEKMSAVMQTLSRIEGWLKGKYGQEMD